MFYLHYSVIVPVWSRILRNVDLATVIVPVSTGCPSPKAYDCTCLGPQKFAWLLLVGYLCSVKAVGPFGPFGSFGSFAQV